MFAVEKAYLQEFTGVFFQKMFLNVWFGQPPLTDEEGVTRGGGEDASTGLLVFSVAEARDTVRGVVQQEEEQLTDEFDHVRR